VKALKVWYQEYELSSDLKLGRTCTWQRYSDEQKQTAVDHYLAHGRCLAFTVKALGYPCSETLNVWIEELHPGIRDQVVGKAAGVPHSPEIKQAAVIELCTRQVSAQAIAQKLAVSRPTLYNWKNQLLGRETPSSMKCQNDSSLDSEQTELQQQVKSLQQDIRQLRLEHDLLKKANELLKKGLGVDLPLLTNREKTILVDALKQTYALSELLIELGLARSSYFYHRVSLRKPDKYAAERLAMKDVFDCNHRCYGYRRMRSALGKQQVYISEKVVQRLMGRPQNSEKIAR
jgi:transposase-like protein